jgi:hypothetical protein
MSKHTYEVCGRRRRLFAIATAVRCLCRHRVYMFTRSVRVLQRGDTVLLI